MNFNLNTSINSFNCNPSYNQSLDILNEYRQNINILNNSFIKIFSNNFQTNHMKSCSKWVAYFSEFNEIWGFFTFFYAVSLIFFFFYIMPESYIKYKIKTNAAMAKGWIANIISCGVPFFVLFSIMFESMYMGFLNDVFLKKSSSLFTIEGRQWKWEYRFNVLCFIEYISSYKNLGNSGKVTVYKFWNETNSEVREHLYSIIGKYGFDENTKVKADLLKNKKNQLNYNDFFYFSTISESPLNFQKNLNFILRKRFLYNLYEDFFMFRLTENIRKSVTTSRLLLLPNFETTRCFITGCDVIHSWTIPNMGIRIDAVPGKLYNLKISPKHSGIFVGQCSEVCGLRHAYMPIVVNFVSTKLFLKYMYTLLFFPAEQLDSFFFKKNNIY